MPDLTQSTYTDLKTTVTDYTVSPVSIDEASLKETSWENSNFTQYLAYYKKIPEYKAALNAYATWVIGKGWTSDLGTKVILEHIDGWGEDTFLSIIWNLLVMKKLQGDAYAEVVRDEKGNLINLKPLGKLKHICNKHGRLLRYESYVNGENKKFEPEKILHLCNDRIANEIHGVSITESVEWVILARNEAMTDYRRILHRATIRVMEVDEEDKSRLATLKSDYATAIKKGELLLVPKGSGEFQDLTPPAPDTFLSWIKYLENFFYQALGVPKVILGGSEEFTEASSKIGYLTFEQIYMREVEELKADLWNQLGIKIEINKPASLRSEMLSSEEKNTGQVGFQPNDMMAGVGK